MKYSREYHWRNVAEDDEDKSKIHVLGWDLYTKQKQELIDIRFLVYFLHPKGGYIVWNCAKDNIIKKRED